MWHLVSITGSLVLKRKIKLKGYNLKYYLIYRELVMLLTYDQLKHGCEITIIYQDTNNLAVYL